MIFAHSTGSNGFSPRAFYIVDGSVSGQQGKNSSGLTEDNFDHNKLQPANATLQNLSKGEQLTVQERIANYQAQLKARLDPDNFDASVPLALFVPAIEANDKEALKVIFEQQQINDFYQLPQGERFITALEYAAAYSSPDMLNFLVNELAADKEVRVIDAQGNIYDDMKQQPYAHAFSTLNLANIKRLKELSVKQFETLDDLLETMPNDVKRLQKALIKELFSS